MRHTRFLSCLAVLALGMTIHSIPLFAGDGADAAEDEEAVVKRFWRSYTTAARPILRADTVYMLRGLKEPKSLRTIAGLLGDTTMEVRRNACRLMAESDDPDGYFVKPLVGALIDKSPVVQVAAVRALAKSKVKAHAIKAMVFALQERSDEAHGAMDLSDAMHETLMALSGKVFGKGDSPKEQAQAWLKYWQENREALETADETYRAKLKEEREKKAQAAVRK